MTMEPDKDSFQEPASFRDPSGFVFHREGSIFWADYSKRFFRN